MTGHDRLSCQYVDGCTDCRAATDDDTQPPYVLHERADGGWWVMRHPDDPTGDYHGYVDGYVECLVAGAWRAVSWDRETVAHGATRESAADQLMALRWSTAPGTPGDPYGPADGDTEATQGQPVDHPDPDDDGAHLLGIVLALAATYPVSMGECTLCVTRAPGAAVTLVESDHQAHCPWRQARSYSADLAAARRDG